ncbi:diphthamide biosynthesis protein [Schizosaccharomyces japonicus yFS275]|uniref:2-(3-amino-3-carboxypropyl)histidine synthase subunit 2 n=1 Tax=Schizosaccharomyces japonicus (strain yFS275 / FY16936) TaxID=402676 RepID=B6K5V9_SCHJY|nr:diphthamide biosynthesis protein [Schizosaccharomyces japonicus yFS275]EEB08913.1 diphthamide biosynthesis protein [Schizosaccharomyces japonicus yFS275]
MSFELHQPVPLSNNSEDVLKTEITVEPVVIDDFVKEYEIDDTAKFINEGGYKNVALQFPDEHLQDAVKVADALSKSIDASVHVLADTNYGSCCVDEVAAEHMGADALVHYGRACLSPTTRLPVHYVLGQLKIDIEKCTEEFTKANPPTDKQPILLICDTRWFWAQSDIQNALMKAGYPTVCCAELSKGEACEEIDGIPYGLPGRRVRLPDNVDLADATLLFVGPESPTLTTVLMGYYSRVQGIYSFDPVSSRLTEESTPSGRRLRRRYALLHKCRDAGIIGIVVGTLGVKNYLTLLDRLRKLILDAGKKPYMISIGKLNAAKLANFQEIECFVIIACGENSLVDSRDFYQPVVSPYELVLALSPELIWKNEWITDFERVLSLADEMYGENNSEEEEKTEKKESEEEEPHFSLMTGQFVNATPMRQHIDLSVENDSSTEQGMIKHAGMALASVNGMYSPAAAFLQKKEWRGLQSAEGEEASELYQGLSGIAKGYNGEASQK